LAPRAGLEPATN